MWCRLLLKSLASFAHQALDLTLMTPSDDIRRVVAKKLRIFIFAIVHDWTKHQAVQVRLMKYGSHE
jgi:hypothetical protein